MTRGIFYFSEIISEKRQVRNANSKQHLRDSQRNKKCETRPEPQLPHLCPLIGYSLIRYIEFTRQLHVSDIIYSRGWLVTAI